MFWILPRFGKIGVCIFQYRILVAMAQLFLHAGVSLFCMILSFGCALRGILIFSILEHPVTS